MSRKPMTQEQPDLLTWSPPAHSEDAMNGLLSVLQDGEWRTAADICSVLGLPPTESNRRRIRFLADASSGRVAGGQRGYKLVARMQSSEFKHTRNWLLSQCREMQRRVIEMDRVFYARNPVPAT